MKLKPKGAHAAMMGARERYALGIKLIRQPGEFLDYFSMSTPNCCYDAVAFIRFLLSNRISVSVLLNTSCQAWIDRFKFENGYEWDGVTPIEMGDAIGFSRVLGTNALPAGPFHATISCGGSSIRGINNQAGLGVGWSQKVNMKTAVGDRDSEGIFTLSSGEKIKIFISRAL